MTDLTVTCPCGASELRIQADAITSFYCHCDDDQLAHGGPMVGITIFPEEAVSLSGATREWKLRTTPRIQCGECGTRMLTNPPGAPVVGVTATLLPREMFEPAWHQQCQFSTVPVADDRPHYKGFPIAMGGASDETVDW
jgi:hypothetical protein